MHPSTQAGYLSSCLCNTLGSSIQSVGSSPCRVLLLKFLTVFSTLSFPKVHGQGGLLCLGRTCRTCCLLSVTWWWLLSLVSHYGGENPFTQHCLSAEGMEELSWGCARGMGACRFVLAIQQCLLGLGCSSH